MNDIIAKFIAMWISLNSPDGGVPVQYLGNHDGDSVKAGISCTGPVKVTMMVEGITDISAFAPPLVLTVPCSTTTHTIPLDIRVAGIDTPEVGASSCPSQEGRDAERAAGIATRDAVARWLKQSASLSLHNLDHWSEKWGRTLGRIEFTGPVGTDQADVIRDLGSVLILGRYAEPYTGGTKASFCNAEIVR